jgi:hypothetical protein
MSSDVEQQRRELAELKAQVSALESQVRQALPDDDQWNHDRFYGTWYGTVGFVYGGIAAMVSLLFNVVGSSIVGKHPLEIIRVYMTFPLGDKALALSTAEGTGFVIDDGMILALGCCLYIGTGMVLGVLFHWVIGRFALKSSIPVRLMWGTGLALAVWAVNFYGILSWLQPALFEGDWITSGDHMEWWVALTTHLVFGWTMALMAPLGAFQYYRRPTETVQA